MGETDTPATLAGYRDEVTEPVHEGYSFGDVEGAIDGGNERTQGAKAAPWLLAFSLRARLGALS